MPDRDDRPTRLNCVRSFLRLLGDGIVVPLALVYAVAAAAFGCSGSVSISSGNANPNRAHGTYTVTGGFGESASSVFFGYWLSGSNAISDADAEAFRDAVGPISNSATVTIVPSSILYEETAVETATGRLVTVSISGTWQYTGVAQISVDWGSAFVTQSTFPPSPPFHVATVGTLINGPQPNDTIFSNASWTQLTSVAPGPFNGVFSRTN